MIVTVDRHGFGNHITAETFKEVSHPRCDPAERSCQEKMESGTLVLLGILAAIGILWWGFTHR